MIYQNLVTNLVRVSGEREKHLTKSSMLHSMVKVLEMLSKCQLYLIRVMNKYLEKN